MFCNGFLNRIGRAIAVFAMLVSLLIGDIVLFPNVALAKPGFLPQLGTAENILSGLQDAGDPFDRNGDPDSIGREFRPVVTTENCFWKMILSASPYHNAFYPDAHSAYPTALFSLPEGSHVELTGDFPHARSLSFTTYFYDPDSDTLIGGDDQILDFEIEPDEGSTNPFLNGSDRNAENRSYTIQLVPGKPPSEEEEERPANTLYIGENELPDIGYIAVMRVYVPDKGTNLLGGTELPEAKVILADGSIAEGDELCQPDYTQFRGELSSVFPTPAFDPDAYLRERDRTEWYNQDRPDTWPAQNPPYIIREWTAKYNFCANFEQGPENAGNCPPPGNPNIGSGGFINPTTSYMTTWMDRGFGEVMILQGKKPKTPKTYFNNPIFDESDAEVRYFSWITEEPLSRSRVIDAVFDEEIPVDDYDNYTIVISRPAYRPKHAYYECGYAWLEFPAAGDGFGDMWLGEIRNRWQLSLNDFKQTPGDAENPGEEAEVMGDYFPKGQYFQTPDEFDNEFPCKSQTAQ